MSNQSTVTNNASRGGFIQPQMSNGNYEYGMVPGQSYPSMAPMARPMVPINYGYAPSMPPPPPSMAHISPPLPPLHTPPPTLYKPVGAYPTNIRVPPPFPPPPYATAYSNARNVPYVQNDKMPYPPYAPLQPPRHVNPNAMPPRFNVIGHHSTSAPVIPNAALNEYNKPQTYAKAFNSDSRPRSRSKSRSSSIRFKSRSPSRNSRYGRNRSRGRSRSRSRSRSNSRSGKRFRNSGASDRDRDRYRDKEYHRYDRRDNRHDERNDRYSSSSRSDYYKKSSSTSSYSNSSRNDMKRISSDNYLSSRRRRSSASTDDTVNSSVKSNDYFQSKVSYIQTTLIPIYYSKDEQNAKLIHASEKLKELCAKFQMEIISRSRIAREKANLPPESTQIPDYRQLLLTKKFSNFTRCTCDHPNEEKSNQNSNHKHSTSCRSHRARHRKTSSNATSSEDSNDDDEEDGDEDDDNFSTTSSENSGSCSDASTNSKKKAIDDKAEQTADAKIKSEKNNENKFEDIRSMEIHRKQNHPERLHPDLSFNEPEQTNDGPLCKCKLKNTTFGTRHQIYYGEKPIEHCDPFSNNAHRLFHYRMCINPFNNFISKHPTVIDYDGHDYVFEGYSIFSHEKIENIPECVVVIYNHEYKLSIVKEDMIENFTVMELELLKQFIFVELLELYDLKWKGYNIGDDACNRFHVLPRFSRPLPYNGKEILSPCELLKYFINNNSPVIDKNLLAKCHLMSNREWLSYVEPLQGSIVTNPGKRPASIRLDQLDRDHIMKKMKDSSSAKNQTYPLIIHFSMFRNTWLPMIKNNMKLKKLYHKYFKLRHLLNNKTKLTTDDRAKLRALREELQSLIRKATEIHKEIMVELTSENFLRTGIRTDIVQQTVLVPTFVEHIRFHLSLKFLEEKICYSFKNRLLLQHALTHPSGAFLLHQNLGSNPDHIRNCLFNCKDRNTNYGMLTPQKRKSLLRKKGIHMLFSIMSQKGNENEECSSISNYERLEFLGDKILELLTSKHLFFMFANFDEGQLSEYRNAIVQNQYLAVLARKLDMHYFIIFYHGVDLCSNSALNHALANSFEALLAAIFLDSNLDTVSNMLAKTLWKQTVDESLTASTDETTDDSDLLDIWENLAPHPIQAQFPKGDRHLIANTKILQHVNQYEEMIGVEFKHIRLLAQAFCTRSASYNLITLGDNQRLEFLGDTVLNFVVSDYLYRHFPNHHEGHLSLLRSSLVCNSTQALLYDELGMSDFVLSSYINSRNENSGNLKRKADVFEAFVGALYIDQGLEAVRVFCNVCIFNKLQDIILYQFWHDPKSRLQQCCLSLRDVDESKPSLPKYKLIEEKGPPNNKQYRVAVYFNRKRIGEGVGKSIHDSEVEAAKNALKTNAEMFPILNKYISSEFKNSRYCPDDFKTELGQKKKRKKKKKNPATIAVNTQTNNKNN